jgi:hypothetical protein
MTTGFFSEVLARQLEDVLIQAAQRRGAWNPARIIEEIAILERPILGARKSQTKPAEELRRGCLRGLWHKHHTQAVFMLPNVALHWRKGKRLDQFLASSLRPGSKFDAARAFEMTRDWTRKGYLERAKAGKLTGQWIVYAKQGGVNYYLTLGTHGDDEAIWSRAKSCSNEFPELAILREDRAAE